MASADYTTQIQGFGKTPVDLVKFTVPGTITGNQVFRFSSRNGPLLSTQLGQSVKPLLLTRSGRPTRIEPELASTQRASRTLEFADESAAGDFDSAVFTVYQGGSFWRRLIVAQPVVVGWTVEIIRVFVASGFIESEGETLFKGRTENFQIRENGNFTWTVKDILDLSNHSQPPEITKGNSVDGSLLTSDSTFNLLVGSEFTQPSDLNSKDRFPIVIRFKPDSADFEDVIVKTISGNAVTVQDNYLNESEDFSDTDWWTVSGCTVSVNEAYGPFGGEPLADHLSFAAQNDTILQSSSKAAASQTATFSVWMKTVDNAASTSIKLKIADNTASESQEDTETVGPRWARYSVTDTFTGSASGNIKCTITNNVAGAAAIYAFGAQLEIASTAGFYAATSTNRGATAGRAAYGTTATSGPFVEAKEVLCYRNQLSDDGVNPVAIILDLLNRSGLATTDLSENDFWDTFDAVEALSFRRGKATRELTAGAGIPADTSIVAAEDVSNLMKVVREQSLIDVWVNESGLVTCDLSYGARTRVGTYQSFTDETHIITNSSAYAGNQQSRVTRCFVHFDRGGKQGERAEEYRKKVVFVDTTSEANSAKKKVRNIFSLWIYRGYEATYLSSAIVNRFKTGAIQGRWNLGLKNDLDVNTGDLITIDSTDVLKASGTTATRTAVVFKVSQKNSTHMNVQVEGLRGRDRFFGNIAPSSVTIDYDASSAAQKEYIFVSDTNNQLGAANDEGYVFL